jgi:hypothetical protein
MANESEEYLISILGERNARIFLLRKRGVDYKDIGLKFEISRTRARQITEWAERKLAWQNRKRTYIFDHLTVRVRHCLRFKGLIDKDSIKKAVKSGALYPRCVGNYGIKSHREVCDWLGLDYEIAEANRKNNLSKERKMTHHYDGEYRQSQEKPIIERFRMANGAIFMDDKPISDKQLVTIANQLASALNDRGCRFEVKK